MRVILGFIDDRIAKWDWGFRLQMTIDINGAISPSNAEASCFYVDDIGYWKSQESASHKMGSQRMGSVQGEKYFLNNLTR
jgi:hypothetical protein